MLHVDSSVKPLSVAELTHLNYNLAHLGLYYVGKKKKSVRLLYGRTFNLIKPLMHLRSLALRRFGGFGEERMVLVKLRYYICACSK